MSGTKLQDEINNIPLADDDPQGKFLINRFGCYINCCCSNH